MDTHIWLIITVVLLSYLMGSLPTGYLLGRLRGIDIRTVGSGNLGATNVMRVLGAPAGIAVMVIDMLKGFAAVYWLVGLTTYPEADWLKVGCGLAAVLGHTFTIFLKFKGGKGVATAAGVFLALAPIATSMALAIFVSAVILTRYISAGSMLAAFFLPILIWIVGESGQYFSVLVIALFLALVILLRHRDNFSRIMKGTENKLGHRVSVDSGVDHHE